MKFTHIDIDYNKKIWDSYITVEDGGRVYKVTKNDVFVEAYLDSPQIDPAKFWQHYAYSGKAAQWFPQLDPETIKYSVSPGQYNIGSDIRAYGRLLGSDKELVQGIKDYMEEQKKIGKEISAINKQIADLEDIREKLFDKTRYTHFVR